jgi:hypothetical protein
MDVLFSYILCLSEYGEIEWVKVNLKEDYLKELEKLNYTILEGN